MEKKELIIIESLTVPVCLWTLLPLLLDQRSNKGRDIYYVDATRLGAACAKALSRLFKANVFYLEFSFFDIRDENGYLIRIRIPYQDVAVVRGQIIKDPLFQSVLNDPVAAKSGLKHYFSKQFLVLGFEQTGSLSRVMALTHIALWKNKRIEGGGAQKIVLYTRGQLWMKYLTDYAKEQGVFLKQAMPKICSWEEIIIHGPGKYKLRFWWCFWKRWGKPEVPLPAQGVKLNVDYNGHLNLDDPRMHSDLFFCRQGAVEGRDILMNFRIRRDPLDDRKWRQLQKHEIKAVGLTPLAITCDKAPFFNHWPSAQSPRLSGNTFRGFAGASEIKWFKKGCRDYFEQYYYWRDFFSRTRTKIYNTWYKYDAQHMIMTDAIHGVGGILSVYQRAYEDVVRPETCVWADVVFGFSREGIELEKASLSVIPYYVVTGYVGDCRLESVRPMAREIRTRILKNGARHIVAYFDENSQDTRWHTGHKPMRENYVFLLEKILQDPRLGLVIKPKTPVTLRQRLAHVNDLLVKAEATGRCFVFEEGSIQGSHPPAVAALACDFAIHGHLCASTAGFESALAGVPTLLLDREGWPTSKLHGLGPRVAFTDWEDLWKICEEHWQRPGGLPGFGDWSPMIKDMDPFRDGKAAYRIGSYLKWLLDGFKNNLPREKILAEAADRYREQWGSDKIASINCSIGTCA
ncbi:MAG: hypothetical protein HY591_00650 [Candidatus Omnitrophica bacterium]|nr:hypothetical protein [Candidatus Omnitrophota bacterium]